LEKAQLSGLIGEVVDDCASGCLLGAPVEWEWADRVDAVIEKSELSSSCTWEKETKVRDHYAPRESWLVERWRSSVSGVRRWATSFPDEGVLMLRLLLSSRTTRTLPLFLLFTLASRKSGSAFMDRGKVRTG
jgi:hypothetical protein